MSGAPTASAALRPVVPTCPAFPVYRYVAAMGVPYDVEPAWAEAAVVTFRGWWRLPW